MREDVRAAIEATLSREGVDLVASGWRFELKERDPNSGRVIAEVQARHPGLPEHHDVAFCITDDMTPERAALFIRRCLSDVADELEQ